MSSFSILSMMAQKWSPTVAFAFLVVIQSASSQFHISVIPESGGQSPNLITTTPDTTAMNPITTTTTEPTTTTTMNSTTTTTMKSTTTTTMEPETVVGLITTTGNTVTELNVTIDNKPSTRVDQIDGRTIGGTIGLAVGIGGGGLILLIVLIVVLIVVIKRRQRKSNGDSRTAVESSDGDSDKAQNDVYAVVVPGKNQGNNTETSSETIYTSPLFTREPNSTPPNSDYEEANRVKETYTVSPLRGQARSIYPQEFSDLYANAKEVPKATD